MTKTESGEMVFDFKEANILSKRQEPSGSPFHTSCLRCKRPLKNMHSQIAGYGAICLRKLGKHFDAFSSNEKDSRAWANRKRTSLPLPSNTENTPALIQWF
jgi:hypothetical protein